MIMFNLLAHAKYPANNNTNWEYVGKKIWKTTIKLALIVGIWLAIANIKF